MAEWIQMPKLSPTMESGTIVKWHKKVGDFVHAGELLCEIATDKATMEYFSPLDGILRKILILEQGTAPVGDAIAALTQKANDPLQEKMKPPMPKKESEIPKAPPLPAKRVELSQPAFVPEKPLTDYHFAFPSDRITQQVLASPLAKKIAKEKKLNLTTVRGSGPRGRIVKRDLDLAQSDQKVIFGRREMPDILPGTYVEVPLTPMRKVIAKRLQEAKTWIPHFYLRQEIDAQPIVDIREQLKAHSIRATVNDFIIRATALALREHPRMNSGFDSVKECIVLFQTIDISMAVMVDGGIWTPIIRHADYKNLGEISVESQDFSHRAKLGKLQPSEYLGGSFTISNLGMFGITDFVPIINPPQSTILGVGGIEDCVRMKPKGRCTLGKKMNLVLAMDHRVIDGVDAAHFIKTVQKYLENPAVLII